MRTISGYVEKHHIIPKSMGGSDDASNIVELTAREHFIAHLLLTKMTDGEDRRKMSMAVMFLKGKHQTNKRNITSRLFETIRTAANLQKSIQKLGRRNPNFGRKQDEITKAKASKSISGKVVWNNGTRNTRARECPGEGWTRGLLLTDEQRLVRSRNAAKQKPYARTDEHRAAMSTAVKAAKSV